MDILMDKDNYFKKVIMRESPNLPNSLKYAMLNRKHLEIIDEQPKNSAIIEGLKYYTLRLIK